MALFEPGSELQEEAKFSILAESWQAVGGKAWGKRRCDSAPFCHASFTCQSPQTPLQYWYLCIFLSYHAKDDVAEDGGHVFISSPSPGASHSFLSPELIPKWGNKWLYRAMTQYAEMGPSPEIQIKFIIQLFKRNCTKIMGFNSK